VATVTDAKWIRFKGPVPSRSGKTHIWAVCPKDSENAIGFISWYGPWRKYAFQPEPKTVFEPTCLRDVAAFIEEQMQQRRRPA
jgi:hypothetical protein